MMKTANCHVIESKILTKIHKPTVSFPLRHSSIGLERSRKMAYEENVNNKNKSGDRLWDTSCFGWQGMPEAMAKCCSGMSKSGDSRSMMAGCMRMCRWFPVIPVIFGIAFLLLGYYLDPSIIRVLWILFAGLMIMMGTFGLVLMGRIRKICC